MEPTAEDRILIVNRMIAGLVVPVLVLAWVILYFFPQLSGTRFAWEIQPPMTAVFMGAGYIGGAWLFLQVVIGRRWHHVAAGFLPVTTFTWAMLLVTALHWSRFDLRHFPFLLWLGLYVVTPFLVPWMWWRNRGADPGIPAPGEKMVPALARWSLRLLGWLLLAFALVGFLRSEWLISIWVWQLSPLTARVLSGWFGLLGTGGVVIANDRRWSAWRVGMQSIGFWHLLVLAGAAFHRGDFTAGFFNWYLVSVVLGVSGMIVLYAYMEWGRPVGSVAD